MMEELRNYRIFKFKEFFSFKSQNQSSPCYAQNLRTRKVMKTRKISRHSKLVVTTGPELRPSCAQTSSLPSLPWISPAFAKYLRKPELASKGV